jgi:hypothetical protein
LARFQPVAPAQDSEFPRDLQAFDPGGETASSSVNLVELEGEMKRTVLGMLMACVIAAPASANIITFDYFGKITDGFDTAGLFGAPMTDLTGDHVLAVFVFDTSLGTRITDPGVSDDLFGGTEADVPSPLVSATITINGKSLPMGGDLFAVAQTIAGQSNSVSTAPDAADDITVITFDTDAPASLDTPFKPHGPGGGTFTFSAPSGLEEASANFSIPEPATWAMMLMGLGGIGAMLRDRRRIAAAAAAGA